MIDLHNHILYGWDVGPQTIEKSLEMAKQAVEVGTTIMAATPHRYLTGRQSRMDIVQDAVDKLNERLQAENIALNVVPGVEIPIDFGIAEEIKKGHLSTLAGGGYVLVEPPFPNLPPFLLPAISELIKRGYGVVLAHPERNSAVQRDWNHNSGLKFVSACGELGCVIQLTSGSILGRFGPSALAASKGIACCRDFKIIIASDSHDPKDRNPGLLAIARDTVAQWIGSKTTADVMVNDLPGEIIGL